jgi:hypothetical protein
MTILGAASFSVQRVAAGSLVNGRWVDGASSTFDIVGSWQPMSGRQREQLPELYRTRETAKLLCDPAQTRLSPVDVTAKTRQDVIVRGGRRYEIIAIEDWTDHAGPTAHIAYTVALIDADEEVRR